MTFSANRPGEIFPVCTRIMGPEKWQSVSEDLTGGRDPSSFPDLLAHRSEELDLYQWLPDLARIEYAISQASSRQEELDAVPAKLCHNPTLGIVKSTWSGLAELINRPDLQNIEPQPGEEVVLVWVKPAERKPLVRSATSEELLALKIVIEGLDKKELARGGQLSLPAIDRAIALAVARGLLLAPPSLLRRDSSIFAADLQVPEEFTITETFTLQWHITQACDLHCKHCYDRSSRSQLTLREAEIVLDQLYEFCQERRVQGQVSFTGGNPLLHPRFMEIYQAASDRGLMTAILGNPTDPATIAEICAIQKPEFFQVSMEGLEEHNDHIRGTGHFQRVLEFLSCLKESDIYSMVMLTLTRNNLDQVLPLAELLRGRTDLFTFNRLSMVGEGARLVTPDRDEYAAFLEKYLEAQPHNPVMALKDNLINIIKHRQGKELFGGCAGFGCGAAFNFVALLPDGEVHACRKFPSSIGNIHQQGLADIYDSTGARRYRLGPEACRGCEIRHVCGGCLAVISSQGLDISKDRDRCCFMDSPDTTLA